MKAQREKALADEKAKKEQREAQQSGFVAADAKQSADFQQQLTTQPQGFAQHTAFGDFWVSPDGKAPPGAGRAEPIAPDAFTRLLDAWHALSENRGPVVIDGEDPAFRQGVLECIAQLLSKPKGRELLLGLLAANHRVFISWDRSGPTRVFDDDNVDVTRPRDPKGAATAGKGSDTTIMLARDLSNPGGIFGPSGLPDFNPEFIAIGHELIHARHFVAGEDQKAVAPKDKNYDDAEEERTIATGDLTENMLRAEHDLAPRYGHRGEDMFKDQPKSPFQ